MKASNVVGAVIGAGATWLFGGGLILIGVLGAVGYFAGPAVGEVIPDFDDD